MHSIEVSRQWLFIATLVLGVGLVAHSNRLPKAGVSVPEAIALVDAGALVIDVRERSVSAGSHLPGALLIPLEVVAARLSSMEIAKAQRIVVYCNRGAGRGPAAVQALTEAGFTNVVNLESGIEGWRAAGLPTAKS
jgi:rhodanese-related sulfurtransferase